ncbi:PAS domain-containing protein [Halobacteria archaeon AArc-dxtr1]|nr:PAS domain-containing protein [Halobacteria archaeon AArc-dxtr1]
MISLTLLFASDPSYDEDLIHYLESQSEFDVLTARTGAETLALLDRADVDVLLFGRDLPDMDAETLLDRTQTRDPLLPTVFLSDGEYTLGDADRAPHPTTVVQMQRADAPEQVRDRITTLVQCLRGDQFFLDDSPERTSLSRMTDGFYALDSDWQFTSVNEYAETLLQKSAADLIGCNVWNAFPETTDTILYEKYTTAVETGTTSEFEFYHEPLETWFHVTAYPSGDGLSVYFGDITDEILLSQAVDVADLGIIITDPHQSDNPIIYVNQGFEALTGYSGAEALGRNCRFLQGIQTDPDTVSKLRRAIDRREPVTVELINYRKNGTPFWNRLQVTPVFDVNGSLTHFIGFQQDVTTHVEERQRAEMFQRLLRHNLRNSMNVILGQAVHLAETTELDTAQLAPIFEHGGSLLRASDRVRDTDTLLERVRVETTTSVGLTTLCETAATSVSDSYPNAEITTDVPADVRVLGPDALQVVFEELLENAVKHADHPSPSATVTADLDTQRRPDGTDRPIVRVSVIDSGPLLTDQEKTTLLGREETALQHGSGLGLWLVQWLVTMAGGSVTVSEHAAGGNEITVTLLRAD